MRRFALLCTAVAVFAPASAQARTPKSFFGMNVNGPVTDGTVPLAGQMALMRADHVASVRLSIDWNVEQPDKGSPPSFAESDPVVLAAAAKGITTLPTVFHTPAWAAEDPSKVQSPPTDDADYANFLTALVGRYGPNGSLWAEHPEVPRLPIRSWEVWNEPDLTPFWQSKAPWPQRYVQLLHAAHDALKAADPGCTVILAGLPQASWTELAKIYKAGGKPYFDVANVHPYTQQPSNVIKILRLSRQVMAKNGDAKKPLAVTEFTWSSAYNVKHIRKYGWEQSEHGQALRIRQILPMLAAVRVKYRLTSVYWYTWMSPPSGPDSFSYSGLLKVAKNGKVVKKPALAAWTRTVGDLIHA